MTSTSAAGIERVAEIRSLSTTRPSDAVRRCEQALAAEVEPDRRVHLDALLAAVARNARNRRVLDASLSRLSTQLSEATPPIVQQRAFRAAATACRIRGQLAAADSFLNVASVAARALEEHAAISARAGLVIDRSSLMLELDDAAGAIALLLGSLRRGTVVGRPDWLQGCVSLQAAFVHRVLRDYDAAHSMLTHAQAQLAGSPLQRIWRRAEIEELIVTLARGGALEPDRVEGLHADAIDRGDDLLAAAALALRARHSAVHRPALAVDQAQLALPALLQVGERYEASLLIDSAAEWADKAGDLYRSAQLQAGHRQLFTDLELQSRHLPGWVTPLRDLATRMLPRHTVIAPAPRASCHTPPPVDIAALAEQSRHTPALAIEAGRAALAHGLSGPRRARVALAIATAHFNRAEMHEGLDAFAETLDGFRALEAPHEQLRALRMLTCLFDDAGAWQHSERWHRRIAHLSDASASPHDRVAARLSLGSLLHRQGRSSEALPSFAEAEEIALEHDLDPGQRALVTVHLASLYRQLGRYQESLDALHRAQSTLTAERNHRAHELWQAERLLLRLADGESLDVERVRRALAEARSNRSYHLCATLGRTLAEALARRTPRLAAEHAQRAQGDFEAAGLMDDAVAMTDIIVAAQQRIGDPRAVAETERRGARLLRRRFGQRGRAATLLERLRAPIRQVRDGLEPAEVLETD